MGGRNLLRHRQAQACAVPATRHQWQEQQCPEMLGYTFTIIFHIHTDSCGVFGLHQCKSVFYPGSQQDIFCPGLVCIEYKIKQYLPQR